MSTSTRLRALVGAGLLGGSLLLVPGLASADTTTPTTTAPPTAALAAAASTTTTAPSTTTTSETPAVLSADDLLARIAALQCGSTFNTDSGMITDGIQALAGDDRFNEVLGADTDKLAELNNCVPTTSDLDSTASDGSVPITSGGQVSVVPEGSAETGEA